MQSWILYSSKSQVLFFPWLRWALLSTNRRFTFYSLESKDLIWRLEVWMTKYMATTKLKKLGRGRTQSQGRLCSGVSVPDGPHLGAHLVLGRWDDNCSSCRDGFILKEKNAADLWSLLRSGSNNQYSFDWTAAHCNQTVAPVPCTISLIFGKQGSEEHGTGNWQKCLWLNHVKCCTIWVPWKDLLKVFPRFECWLAYPSI